MIRPLIAAVALSTSLVAGKGPSVAASEPLVNPGWQATAYCKGTKTAFGHAVKRGMVAADPKILPIGSIVKLSYTGNPRWDGTYSVQDTGPAIKGKILDVYLWSCFEALEFGRRAVVVDVVRHGWEPNSFSRP